MRISPNRWNIIQRILREYPECKKELESCCEASIYRDRLIREINAVEMAFSFFSEAEQAVISERFWTDQEKNKSYEQMWDTGYSPRQMRRICYRMICYTGKELGEIE